MGASQLLCIVTAETDFAVLNNSQREQAEEGQYIKKREMEKIKEAQEKVKAAQAELVSLTFTWFDRRADRRCVGRAGEEEGGEVMVVTRTSPRDMYMTLPFYSDGPLCTDVLLDLCGNGFHRPTKGTYMGSEVSLYPAAFMVLLTSCSNRRW